MINFIIFGIVDNAIMILGAMTGLSVEKYLPSALQKGIGTVIGAGIGNALSDFMGGATTASWDLAFGTAFGCIIGLAFIPIFQYITKNWSSK
jgi:hypothetical protein